MRKDAHDIGPFPIFSINGPTTLRNNRCLVELQRRLTTHKLLKQNVHKNNDSNWWNQHRPNPFVWLAGSSSWACQEMPS